MGFPAWQSYLILRFYFIGGFSWADSTAIHTHLGMLARSSEKLDDAMLRGV